ncbi:hypothetical protein ANN_09368 [Periplaneta americana]|uniref:Uncharacterized protein n=1 Tax=Periplaneta americana TaxID=6978 RepID=A0ABQ8TNN7_PERAM|nr:hypothetical protein ANN_09368 [Periplaneta americana]
MSPGSSTESYPAFAHIGLRENPGENLNHVTYSDRKSNPRPPGFAARRANRYSTEADCILRDCLESILNIQFDSHSWSFSTSPISFGGLGIRNVNDICVPPFSASAHGALNFVKSRPTLSSHSDEIRILHMSELFQQWSSVTYIVDLPNSPESKKCWDLVLASKTFDSLFASSSSDLDRARFLQVLPSSDIDTLLDNTSFKFAIALRLGIKICLPHKCICGADVDSSGFHGLSFLKNSGRFSRHVMINDIIKRALISAGFPTILKPNGINLSDGKRPDGLTLTPWSTGKSLLWDATCYNTFASSYTPKTSKLAGSGTYPASWCTWEAMIGSENPVLQTTCNGWGNHRANHAIPPQWLDDRPPLFLHVDVRPAAD